MVCPNCGKQTGNGKLFCPYCGAALQSGAGAEETKKKRLPIWAFIVGGAVLALALCAALLLGGLFGGDRGAVQKAALSSLSAWKDAAEALDLPDMRELTESRKFSQDFSVTIDSVPGMEDGQFSPEGFGLRGSARTDLPGRRASSAWTVIYGAADLLELRLAAEDSLLTVGSPELTGDRVFGLDTATLGRELAALDPELAELSGLSFNIFDISERLLAVEEQNEAAVEQIKAAAVKLYAAAKIKKAGGETLTVNGNSLDCTVYNVVFPAEDVKTFIGEALDAYERSDTFGAVMDIYRSMGMPEDLLEEMEAANPAGEALEEAREALEEAEAELKDVEVEVCLNGGMISALRVPAGIGGTDANAACVYLGGGSRYTDDLSVVFYNEDGTEGASLLFSGDHTAQTGAFTDTMVLRLDGSGGEEAVRSRFTLDSGSGDRAFSWHLTVGTVELTAEGTLNGGKNALSLSLDTLRAAFAGEALSLRAAFSLGAYEAPEPAGDPTMLFSLSEEDLEQLQVELSANVSQWIIGLIGKIPALREYVYNSMFSGY